MRHDRDVRPSTTIRPRKLPAIAVTVLLALPLAALIGFRRDVLVWVGEPAWLTMATLTALAVAVTAQRLFNPEPLLRISPAGVEVPRLLRSPIPWPEIGKIQATTQRSGIGEIHDRLIFHFKHPHSVDWKPSKLRRLFGDTPQAAVAVDIGLTWPLRADDAKNVLRDAARLYAGAPDVISPAPGNGRGKRLKAGAMLLAAAALPVISHILDIGAPRQFSEALALYREGKIPAAIPLLEHDARAGDREAAYVLGTLYLNGDGVTRNPAMAAGWFRRAAENRHALAAFNLGNAYRLGLGTPRDIAEAMTWYARAVDEGSAEAAYTMGTMLRLGDQVRRDYKSALVWLKTAAEKGFAPAEHDLGRLYQEGIAVPRDPDAAEAWYRRAATRGYAPARYDLARLMLDGNEQQRGIGLKYLAQSADAGFAPAQRRLAVVYFNGQGIEKDAVNAFKWISLAERTWPAATRADLVREKSRIAAVLTPEDMEQAKASIRTWRPTRTPLQD